MRNIVAHPGLGYKIVGFVDDDPDKGNNDIGRFKALGSTENIPRVLRELGIDEVIVTLPWMYHRKIVSIIAQCEREHVGVRIVPDIFQMTLSHMDVEDLGGIPMIGVREISISYGEKLFKRAMDVTIALAGLVLLFPAFSLDRPSDPDRFPRADPLPAGARGQNEHPFTFYKFRSMYQGAEEEQQRLQEQNEAMAPVQNAQRSTRDTSRTHPAPLQYG